jgi:hypothetical protein
MDMNLINEFAYINFKAVILEKDNNKKADIKTIVSLFKDKTFIIKDAEKATKESLQKAVEVLSKFFTTNEEANKTLYKRWKNIEDKSELELFFHQILHYISTYGLGLEGDDVYSPDKDLKVDIRDVEDLEVVDSITLQEFVDKFKDFISLNIANNSISEILAIAEYFLKNDNIKFDIEIDSILNKEVRIGIMELMGQVPADAEEFLRYVVYKITNNSLYIKNKETIDTIKAFDKYQVLKWLNSYIETNSIVPLASIFNRNKTIFLAFKGNNKEVNGIINKISKVAKEVHNPKETPSYLKITEGIFTPDEVKKEIDWMDISYLAKLYNALKFRIANKGVAFYLIRNNKTYTKKVKYTKERVKLFKSYLKVVKEILETKINQNILDKKIVVKNIKGDIKIAIPTSGKKFVSNIPYGSTIKLKKVALLGIYWENYKDHRIDLDQSLTNQNKVIGWNGVWKDTNITFSMDVTDGRNGASEVFKIKTDKDIGFFLYKVKFYNHDDYNYDYLKDFYTNFRFKFFIINKDVNLKSTQKYMVDMNKVTYQTAIKPEDVYTTLGFVNDNKFIFGSIRMPKASNIPELEPKELMEALKVDVSKKVKFKDLDIKSYEPKEDEVEGVDYEVLDMQNPSKDLLLKIVTK